MQYNGEFPSSMHALKELPGIGNYSAGAILSFAFDKRAVFLDTNMERVMVRLYAIEKHSKHALTNEALEHLERILPHRKTRLESPSKICAALMELGSLLCKPKNPKCHQCPIKQSCKTYEKGAWDIYPKVFQKKKLQKVNNHMFLIFLQTKTRGLPMRKKKVLLVKRKLGMRMGGLWGFPTLEHVKFGQLLKGQLDRKEKKMADNDEAILPEITKELEAFVKFIPVNQPLKSSKMLVDQADILHSQEGVGDRVSKETHSSHQKPSETSS